MRGRVTTLANQKGGVGKTTTAINLSACLAQVGKRVLLVDLDPQCNCTSGLGIEQEEGRSAYRALLGDAEIAEFARKTRVTNLDIIPSEIDLAGAEVDIARSDRYLHRFSDAMRPLLEKDIYDFVFVDCPPSLGILTTNALVASNSVIIPMQCEYYALEGLSGMARVVGQIKSSGANPRLEIEGILMTMYDGRTRLAAQVVEEVRSHFGAKVYDTVIPRTVRLSEAPSYGVPIAEYDAQSSGAKAYAELAVEFLRKTGGDSQKAPTESGLLTKDTSTSRPGK